MGGGVVRAARATGSGIGLRGLTAVGVGVWGGPGLVMGLCWLRVLRPAGSAGVRAKSARGMHLARPSMRGRLLRMG